MPFEILADDGVIGRFDDSREMPEGEVVRVGLLHAWDTHLY